MSFLQALAKAAEGVPKLAARIPEGVSRTRDEIIGLLNPNRRHDDPEEKLRDSIRAEINDTHRFKSFANQRAANFVKWHIDGHDAMHAVSEMIDSAQEVILIMDWWLTPELYLRRPPVDNQQWRLDRLLKRKAEQGVKIHVIVYKEVTQTMTMSSHHTKQTLEALHPNITCMRHPDHIGAKDTVEFWSHHEKVVVVDNYVASVGGLDLCFGRWDTHNHPLADVHPTDFGRTLFAGQDYNNPRIMDFSDVQNYVSNSLSIAEFPRMPWHDVHMTFCGSAVLDVAQHFTERWNEVKKRKYRDDKKFEWLALPHNIEVAPNEAVGRHPHLERWRQVGTRYKQPFHLSHGEVVKPPYKKPPYGTCRVQVVRSVSDWSHGVLTEHSIQNAYIQMIMEANHFIYIENQFFISSTGDNGQVKNQIAKALVERIIMAARDGRNFKVVVLFPEVPAFAGEIKDESSLKFILAAQWRTINRGGQSICEAIRKAGYEPADYIRFYHLRAYDRINAPYQSFISKIEQNSGVKFHEAQVALARLWIGNQDSGNIKEITIKSTTGENPNESEKVPVPASYEAAKQTLEKWESAARQLREDKDVSDSVAHHMLSDETSLDKEKWLGTPEEELNAYVSELLYIHSKLMIVDDRRVIMGSANLNDRSQKGDGDSEIALVVEDDDLIKTTMDNKPYEASRFAATLRRKLYREHLGLIPPQHCDGKKAGVTSFMKAAPYPNEDETDSKEDVLVADPLSEATVDLWEKTAKRNREIFTEIFRPMPTNLVQNFHVYDEYLPKTQKKCHVVPGIPLERVKDRLAAVRGAVVEAPLDFLIDEKSLLEGAEWTSLNMTLPIYL